MSRHLVAGGGLVLIGSVAWLMYQAQQQWGDPLTPKQAERQVARLVAQGYILECSPGRCRVGPHFADLDDNSRLPALLIVYNYLWEDWPREDQPILRVENPSGEPLGQFTPKYGLKIAARAP
jgi:hypothetical protein